MESPNKAHFNELGDSQESVSVSFNNQTTEMPEKDSFYKHKGLFPPGVPPFLPPLRSKCICFSVPKNAPTRHLAKCSKCGKTLNMK